MNRSSQAFSPPPLRHLLREAGVGFEVAAGYVAGKLFHAWPQGDGHPVLVLPGFGASDRHTTLLRRFLCAQGFAAYPWGLGSNLGRKSGLRSRLVALIQELATRHEAQVSLVGWSLGGIFARGLAVTDPDHIRNVVTLGSPFRASAHQTNVRWGLKLIGWVKSKPVVDPGPPKLPAPSVPVTSLFTRKDGIVPWQACLQESSPITENIELKGTHLGLVANPAALYVIAHRLRESSERWQAFEPTTRERWFARPYESAS